MMLVFLLVKINRQEFSAEIILYILAKPLAKRKKNANISVLSVRFYQNFIQQTENFRHIIADSIQRDFRTPIVASMIYFLRKFKRSWVLAASLFVEPGPEAALTERRKETYPA